MIIMWCTNPGKRNLHCMGEMTRVEDKPCWLYLCEALAGRHKATEITGGRMLGRRRDRLRGKDLLCIWITAFVKGPTL